MFIMVYYIKTFERGKTLWIKEEQLFLGDKMKSHR